MVRSTATCFHVRTSVVHDFVLVASRVKPSSGTLALGHQEGDQLDDMVANIRAQEETRKEKKRRKRRRRNQASLACTGGGGGGGELFAPTGIKAVGVPSGLDQEGDSAVGAPTPRQGEDNAVGGTPDAEEEGGAESEDAKQHEREMEENPQAVGWLPTYFLS